MLTYQKHQKIIFTLGRLLKHNLITQNEYNKACRLANTKYNNHNKI